MTVKNKGWFHYTEADTALVFVHGVLSDNTSAWLCEGKSPGKDCYWPDLIRKDKRFNDISIFFAGYHTGIDSLQYGIRNCADELFTSPSNCRCRWADQPL